MNHKAPLLLLLWSATSLSAGINLNLVSPQDPTTLDGRESSPSVAPAAYAGNAWNDLEGVVDIQPSERVVLENMLDSTGEITTASMALGYSSITTFATATLDAARNAFSATAGEGTIEIAGLPPESQWDLIVVTQGEAAGEGTAVTLGGITRETSGLEPTANDFILNGNYLSFEGVTTNAEGRILGTWGPAGSATQGHIAALQLIPGPGVSIPYSRITFGGWFRGGGDQDGALTAISPDEFVMSWVQDTGRTDTSAQTILDAPVYLAVGESLQFSFTMTDIVTVASVDLPFRFGLVNDENATVGNPGTFIAHTAWGVPTGFTKLRASVNTNGNEFSQGTDIFDSVSSSPAEEFLLIDGNTVDFSYTLTKYADDNYAVEILWGRGEGAQEISGSGYVPPYPIDHFNRVFVLVNQTMPGGASFRIINPLVEKRFTFSDGSPVMDDGGLDYEVPVQTLPLADSMSLPVLNTDAPEFDVMFSSVATTSTTATGYGFGEGAEALQAIYAYLHPDSPFQGLDSYLDRLLVLLDGRFSKNWDTEMDFNMDGAFQSVYAYALLKHYEPELAAAQPASWESGIRKMATQVLAAKPLLYEDHIIGELWLNGDIRLALAIYMAGIALDEPAWVETISTMMESVVTETVMEDGGTFYVGYNTEVPTYHAESIQYMLWWWMLTGSGKMLDAVARTLNWVPITTEPAGAVEQSSSITYKHRYNGIFANSAALWKAYLFGDRYNYYFGQTAEGSYDESTTLLDTILYRPALVPRTPPNNYILHDRSISGPRGRFGEWAFLAIGRNVQKPEPDSPDQGYEPIMTGKSTFVGALLLDPERTVPHRNSFRAALDGVTLQVKYQAGDEPDGQPGSYAPYERFTNAWFLAQDEQTQTVTRKAFGSIGTRYNLSRRLSEPSSPSWTGWATDWRGRQLWFMDENRLIGLLDLESLVDQDAYSVNLRVLLSGGRSGIIGQYLDFVDLGNASYGFGPIRMKVHHDGFGGDAAVDRVGVDNRDSYFARFKLHDVDLASPEALRSYPAGTSRKALVEVTRDGVAYAAAEPLTGLPDGLLGFKMLEQGRNITAILNATGAALTLSTSLDALYATNTLHRSWSGEVEALQPSGSSIALEDFVVAPFGHIIVVGSDDPADHEGGYLVYEDVFTGGEAELPEAYWTLSAGEDARPAPGVRSVELSGNLDRIRVEELDSLEWSALSGTGEVVFADSGSPTTQASFPAAGTYVLQLAASDGDRVARDAIQVTIFDETEGEWGFLSPVADASLTREGWRDNGSGMIVANDSGTVSDVYMKFRVPSHVESFDSASLVLNITGDSGIGVLMAFAGSPASWDETTLSLVNAPLPQGSFLDRFAGRVGDPFLPGETLAFDVSPFVTGPGEFDFVFSLNAASNDVQIASRESLRPPYLEFGGLQISPWAHYDRTLDGLVDTGDWLGHLFPLGGNWVYVHPLANYVYLSPDWVSPDKGSFLYLVRDPEVPFLVDGMPLEEGSLPDNAWVDTQDWLGWVYFADGGWVYSPELARWLWIPGSLLTEAGAWIYFDRF